MIKLKDKYNREIIGIVSEDLTRIIYSVPGIEIAYDYPGPPDGQVIYSFEGILTPDCVVEQSPAILDEKDQKMLDMQKQLEQLMEFVQTLQKNNENIQK